MSVTRDDVLHIAALSRIGVEESRVDSLVSELNTILAHMDVLRKVDTSGVGDDEVESRGQLPVRNDDGPQIHLGRPRDQFAPSMRDEFFMVPRLATHEAEAEE